MDVQLNLRVAGHLGKALAKLVRHRTTATDHDARTGGVKIDAKTLVRTLHLDTGDRRVGHLRVEVIADLPILDHIVDVLLAASEPARLPIRGDSQPEAVGIYFLPHQFSSFFAELGVGENPARSASSSVANHTSAIVRP